MKIKKIALIAIFAALTAAFSWISIPLPFTPVPINLALVAVFTCGTILGPLYGGICQLVYMLLGFIGLPVFHNFTGGAGILMGPTGGYIVGYIFAAVLSGLITMRTPFKIPYIVASYVVGLAACYTLGTAWFMCSTGAGLLQALAGCVVPFIFTDVIKLLMAAVVAKRVKRFAVTSIS